MDLVNTHQPLNLGQGFPDYPATGYIPSVLAEVAASNNNAFHQYTRGYVRLFLLFSLNLLLKVDLMKSSNDILAVKSHISRVPRKNQLDLV